MKNVIIFLILVLVLSSCATLFNKKYQTIDIHTNKPVKIAVNNDTVPYEVKHHGVELERKREILHLTLFNENTEKKILVQSRLSTAYWFNFTSPYLAGFLIDLTTQKRFGYPSTIFVDMESTNKDYLTYVPTKFTFPQKKGVFKVTPLKVINIVNPAIEVGYEFMNNEKFSSQISASYILPKSGWDINSRLNPNMRGFSISFEERLYLTRPSPHGVYFGLEFSYLNNNYDRIYSFTDKNALDTSHYYNLNSYSDSIHIKKQTHSLNFKVGYQIVSKRVTFDVFVGLGIRYKDVRHFNRIKPDDVFNYPRHPNFFYIADEEGQYFTVSIPLSFKIGWLF